MNDLFHGKPPSKPSHLKLLCNASYCFKDLFLASSEVNTNKSASISVESLKTYTLKPTLHLNKSRSYIAGIDITQKDLEKKNRSGSQLMTGRQLFDIANKGTSYYRKALAFAARKYDMEKLECKESGSNVDDVIEYVRLQMCKLLVVGKKENDKDPTCEDCADEQENEAEEEYIEHSQNDNEDSPNNNDEDCSDEIEKSTASPDTDDSNQQDIVIPDDYFFPSWFSFITHGPFVPKEERLSLFEINDPHKDIVQSRAEKIKAGKIVKDLERAGDNMNKRGYSND